MTSLLVRHSLRSIPASSTSVVRASYVRANCRIRARALHSSPIVLKKKQQATDLSDDMFGEVEEDLFSSKMTAVSSEAKATTTTTKAESSAPSKKLSAEEKTRRFEELFAKMEAYLDKDLAGKARRRTPPIRHSVWTHMLQLTTTREELERMTGMFGRWKDVTGSKLNEQFSELFIDRCTQLHCPHLALQVFGDPAKYSLPLSLSAARALLHSLHMLPPHGTNTGVCEADLPPADSNNRPTTVSDVMAAAALYRVYELKPIVSDLPSCAMVIAACLRHAYPARRPPTKAQSATSSTTATETSEAAEVEAGVETDAPAQTSTTPSVSTNRPKLPKGATHALNVADALLPQLKELLLKHSPPEKWAPLESKDRFKVSVSKVLAKKPNGTVKVVERTKVKERERDWVRWCLRKVDLLMWRRNQKVLPGAAGDKTGAEGVGEDGRLLWLKEWRMQAGHLKPGEVV
ncbi:hypothetical protein K435DRAFT_967876 [Dendrothele bispora CBS 962.96]|uniref:Uncharacterized protein n=1 Tax=Dendrothele bispora (strain CBS 962.96) TaxID=1314807 RepID=A0A4S8LRU0_DENBC|nr:hypothetical protein K435DRAFT_967876 [Dendrothele bispora CBS 962.96]